ncbi:hypothetical protein CAI21_17805 [Alkalilimnicola ehrlichii]|uniref:Phasin domain-containing protein n=1 Tax=Alkalilimnicola ehrlichii TaxID=351052 RepID=A0A3E0WHR0_9GAMM|nr:phasin family protein [Alkalilimnicola ehrlichii]RFA26182.1 hypothetical protein CAI21_17805 [Alkalilimnicola ehrlichii]RFA31701.1 hypothetical protein CAL65_21705 [Alkalilimnicola ehrlichii]
MFDQMFGSSNAQLESTLAAAKEFNRLSVNTLEKLTTLQIDAARSYTEFSLEQVRNALSIHDAQGLQEFLSSRPKAAEEFGKKVQQDLKTLTDLSTQFSTEAQKLAREQFAGIASQAKKPRKRATLPSAVKRPLTLTSAAFFSPIALA